MRDETISNNSNSFESFFRLLSLVRGLNHFRPRVDEEVDEAGQEDEGRAEEQKRSREGSDGVVVQVSRDGVDRHHREGDDD